MKCLYLFLVAVIFVGGCATPVSVDNIKGAKRIVIVSALEPAVFGQKAGFGDHLASAIVTQAPLSGVNMAVSLSAAGVVRGMGRGGWYAKPAGFDLNKALLNLVRENLNTEAVLVDGESVGLAGSDLALGVSYAEKDLGALKSKIEMVGREHKADVVIVIHSTSTREWIQNTTGRLIYGVGHFDDHFNGIFCVLMTSVYDCRSGKLNSSSIIKHARRPGQSVSWHESWEKYPDEEQRMVLRGLQIVLREGVPVLLNELGLAKEPVASLPIERTITGIARPKTFAPDGNEFVLPAWASVRQGREAVLAAFKRHDWLVTDNTENCIVGTHPKGGKEAVCTVTFDGRKFSMIPTAFSIGNDGKRTPSDPIMGWHENLKVAVVDRLMKAPQEEQK